MNSKKICTIAGLAMTIALPASAIDLGAGVSLGGVSAGVGVSVGHGSVASASVDVGTGSTSASIGADVGSYGDLPGNEQTAGNPGTEQTGTGAVPEEAAFVAFIGRNVTSSDGVVLGKVSETRPGIGACPSLGVSPNPILAIPHDRVWLKIKSCSSESGAIRIGMRSRAFVESMSN